MKLAHRRFPALVALTLIVAAAISVPAADWPQWRGPNRDGFSQEKDLLQRWPQEGPKLVWKATDIGSGSRGVSFQLAVDGSTASWKLTPLISQTVLTG